MSPEVHTQEGERGLSSTGAPGVGAQRSRDASAPDRKAESDTEEHTGRLALALAATGLLGADLARVTKDAEGTCGRGRAFTLSR